MLVNQQHSTCSPVPISTLPIIPVSPLIKNQALLIDLPGTYSLTSFSLEERVTRDFLISEKPDVIVNVVDASSLKRSLYFTFQVLEIGFPVAMALNMMDVATRNGIQIDIGRLQHRLGVDVIPTVGRGGKGKKNFVMPYLQRQTGKKGRLYVFHTKTWNQSFRNLK